MKAGTSAGQLDASLCRPTQRGASRSPSRSWTDVQVVLLDEERRQRVVVEEEVGLVDEAHVGRLFARGEHLPADVERPQLHVLAGPGRVGLAPVVRHHLVFGRPHAQVVNHLETRAK